jgi:Protein of unknown function (DUF1592)/Protein of unknown function (DUF1588)/Protein of unknown function (DUF1587)/Protein of unknown function (DUF1595)/Protein of unknown function (DUF1585)/Planctomycete cytochrome C
MKSSVFTLALVLISSLALGQDAPPVPADQPGYTKTVAPFLKKYCTECHDGDKPEAEFAVDAKRLGIGFGDPATRQKWREVVNVLNSHEMPPEKETQPSATEVAAVVDWITEQTVRAELILRERTVVMRRLNRSEYHNTIRDLIGVDFNTEGFPQDPPAGGFDNNGGALTLSPLHVELYLQAAQQILDRALVEGDRPASVKWRFEPKAGAMDRTRKRLDDKNNPIVNGNNNTQEGEWVVIHHNSWDKNVGARDFRVPVAGMYAIRVQAAGRTPTQEQVIASAEKFLAHRRDEQDAKNPAGKKYTQAGYERDLEHFKTDRMYHYGPPRVKLNLHLGPLPRTLAEFDATGSPEKPQVHEFQARFTTESAGVGFEYAYSIPKVLENFWMQGHNDFARPELLISWFEVEGPLYDAWPPTSHTGILFPSPLATADETKYVREVLTKFMTRAFRRPVEPAEVDAKLALFTANREGKSLVEAIKLPLIGVLTSPHFLYLVERVEGSGERLVKEGSAKGQGTSTKGGKPPVAQRSSSDPQRSTLNAQRSFLSPYELASRLSYLLWSSMPDDELMQLAATGKLSDPKVRQAQVDRMLADPKSESFVENFAGQWLGLRDVGNNPPAEDLYPQYDRHLETSMVGESEAYFAEFLKHDLDARQMIQSDFVTINERLARFYGIPDVQGDQFRRVPVPAGVHRGGIVTQASILVTTSNGTRTSPVKRGTWVLKTLLGTDPGLPVANAGEIAPKVPGIDKATVRKRLEIHRELPQCARCHSKIDPLGFALENFNATGEWRDREGFGYKGRIERDDPLIDASSKMPDGTEITGVEGLQTAMLKQEDLFLNVLATKLLTYACGRELGLADQPTVKASVAEMKSHGYTLRSLLKSIVVSDAFSQR